MAIFSPIQTEHAPAAIGPYSQGLRADRFLFLSGQIPLDPLSMTVVEGGIEQQAHRVFLNLQAVLEAAGASFSNVVQLTIYLMDMNEFAVVNRVMQSFFAEPYPARATVQVSRLPKDVQVEVSAIAILRGEST